VELRENLAMLLPRFGHTHPFKKTEQGERAELDDLRLDPLSSFGQGETPS
jgi:hypothetical protein